MTRLYKEEDYSSRKEMLQDYIRTEVGGGPMYKIPEQLNVGYSYNQGPEGTVSFQENLLIIWYFDSNNNIQARIASIDRPNPDILQTKYTSTSLSQHMTIELATDPSIFAVKRINTHNDTCKTTTYSRYGISPTLLPYDYGYPVETWTQWFENLRNEFTDDDDDQDKIDKVISDLLGDAEIISSNAGLYLDTVDDSEPEDIIRNIKEHLYADIPDDEFKPVVAENFIKDHTFISFPELEAGGRKMRYIINYRKPQSDDDVDTSTIVNPATAMTPVEEANDSDDIPF